MSEQEKKDRRAEPDLPAEVVRVVMAARESAAEWLKCRLAFGMSDSRRLDCEREAGKLNSSLAAYDRWLAGRSESE